MTAALLRQSESVLELESLLSARLKFEVSVTFLNSSAELSILVPAKLLFCTWRGILFERGDFERDEALKSLYWWAALLISRL